MARCSSNMVETFRALIGLGMVGFRPLHSPLDVKD
jgi:hypothetical protein